MAPLIRVFIVEDQPDIRSEIQFLVNRQKEYLVVGACGSVKDARLLIQKEEPELLLLDIQLSDGTGFDVLEGLSANIKIIFLTGYKEHAIQAIKLGALDYILKPINEAEFLEALAKASQHFPNPAQINIARTYHQENKHGQIVLRSLNFLQVVDIDQIMYCQSDGGYTSFFISDGNKVVVTRPLKDYDDILSELRFLRPHQSYLVNFQFVSKYKKDGILILKNGIEIPVASRRKEAILEYFNRL